MPITNGMKSVSEIAHVGALDQLATPKGLSDSERRDGVTWSFQLLSVADDRTQKWFFRHNEPYERLQERAMVAQTKQNERDAAKRKKWGPYNTRRWD